jgi:hypothetical protein
MFKLSSNISIKSQNGTIRFNYVASVSVMTSIMNLTDTATVIFSKKLAWKDKSLGDLIRPGDQITIELGYNDNNEEVFSGYIRNVKNGTPFEIDCEDKMRLIKLTKVPAKMYPSLTLSDLLNDFCPIDYVAADVDLGQFSIEQETTLAKILDFIRSEYGLNFFIRDEKLYGAIPSTLIGAENGWDSHYFESGTETSNSRFDKLEYLLADDVNLIIKAKNILKDNTKIEVQEPADANDGEIRTFFCDYALTESTLREFAKEKLKTFKVDQMKGSFEALGKPLVKKGDSVKLNDAKNPEWKDREFLVNGVKYLFNTEGKGFTQLIELGYQIQ